VKDRKLLSDEKRIASGRIGCQENKIQEVVGSCGVGGENCARVGGWGKGQIEERGRPGRPSRNSTDECKRESDRVDHTGGELEIRT